MTSAKPSGVDKLNGYRHAGDTAILSKEMKWGVFRTGAWYDWAYTDRYQYPSNIVSQLDTPFPNFHEHFETQSFQPFAEFEWHPLPRLVVTAGIKAADYQMTLNQYQDNGKIVGCLGGTLSTFPATSLVSGLARPNAHQVVRRFVTHQRQLQQLAADTYCPLSPAEPLVGLCPVCRGQYHSPERRIRCAGRERPCSAEAHIGKELPGRFSVEHMNRWTLDVDAYYVFISRTASTRIPIPLTNEAVFVPTGPSNTKGIEFESNIVIGHGLSIYGNGSQGLREVSGGRFEPSLQRRPAGGEHPEETSKASPCSISTATGTSALPTTASARCTTTMER